MISRSYYPTRVIIEEGGFRKVVSEAPMEIRSLYVVSGKQSMRKAGVLDELAAVIRKSGIECSFSDGISTNPTDVDVDRLCVQRAECEADAVLGIGGGSSIDAAKLVALQATNGGKVWDYINLKERPAKKIEHDPLPIIAIPTTSGAASESTPYAVITNEEIRVKKGVSSPKLYPVLCIIDPQLLLIMPPRLVAITGFDAFGQALEGFTSGNSTFLSEYFGYSSLTYIVNSLEKSWEHQDDIKAKINMAWGSLLSGLSIGLADVNLAHAMSHPLSAHYNLQHGLAVLLCTFQAIRFNQPVVGEKYERVAGLFDNGEGGAAYLIEKLHAWVDKFGIDLALKNYGIPESDLDKFAEDALQIGAIKTNPRPVTKGDLVNLYTKIWRGDID